MKSKIMKRILAICIAASLVMSITSQIGLGGGTLHASSGQENTGITALDLHTTGFDTTNQAAGKIIANGGGRQEAWFDTDAAEQYVIKVRVSEFTRNNDDWPSVGMLVGDDIQGNGLRLQLFTGWQGTGENHGFKVYDVNSSEPPLDDEYHELVGTSQIETQKGAELMVVRDGKKFDFYINGGLVYSGEHELLRNAGYAGFYANGANAVFSDWSYSALDNRTASEKLFGNKDTDVSSDLDFHTQGFDTTNQNAGKIVATGGGRQEVWFAADAAEKYMIQVSMAEFVRNNDDWPSVGLLVGDDIQGNGVRLQLFTGWQGTAAKHGFKVYDVNSAEPPLDNAYHELPGTSGIETTEGAKLTVIRDGKYFEFYINDKMVYYGESDLLANAGYAGFYTNGANAVLSDYSYTVLAPEPEPVPEYVKNLFGDKATVTTTDVKEMSQGLDMSKKTEGEITVTESGKQEIWFDVDAAEQYVVRVTASNVSALNDEWPSVGMLVGDDGQSNGVRLQLFTGYNGEGLKHTFKVYDLLMSEPTLDNTYHELDGKSGVESAEGVELVVVRDGKKFDFYIAGKLVYSGESELLAKVGHAGFYANGANAVFTNYSYTTLKKDDNSSSEKDLLKQVFGDKKTITVSDVKGMSQGLDMSKKDEGIIKATESGKQEVWFNVGKADKYIVKVTVSDVSALNDEWPSVGLLVGDDGLNNGVRLQLFTGYNGEGMKHLFKVYNLQMAEPTLDNTYHELAGKSGAETSEGVELMVVRDGKKFDFYIAGKLVYSGESDLLANAGYAGFYSNGAKAVFSNYSYTALSTVPKTGDTSEGFLFAAMASLSLVVIGVYVVNAKKKQYN